MAIASIVIALIVASAVVYREWLHGLFYRPKLEVAFSLEEPICRKTALGRRIQSSDWRDAFWVRLRITNVGRTAAMRCEAILNEVRTPEGNLDKHYDPLALRWAIAPINRGLEPLNIARGRTVDLNVFYTVMNETNIFFVTHEDPRGIPLFLEPGDYWLGIVIYGDNLKPVASGLAVHWDGNHYTKVNVQVMQEAPTTKTHWPFPLLSANSGPPRKR